MNCQACEERISDYLEGELDEAGRGVMDLHFESCSACSALLAGVGNVIEWGREFPVHDAPVWLPARIVATTPKVIRLTWRDLLATGWGALSEPRFAMSLLTATLFIGWFGSASGISPSAATLMLHPSGIYEAAEGWMTRAYGDVMRTYYNSPLVNEIYCHIHTRIDQFRENS